VILWKISRRTGSLKFACCFISSQPFHTQWWGLGYGDARRPRFNVCREHNVDYREILDFSASITRLVLRKSACSDTRMEWILFAFILTKSSSADPLPVGPLPYPQRQTPCGQWRHRTVVFLVASNPARTATLIIPTFIEYRRALASVGAAVETVQLNEAEHFRLRWSPATRML